MKKKSKKGAQGCITEKGTNMEERLWWRHPNLRRRSSKPTGASHAGVLVLEFSGSPAAAKPRLGQTTNQRLNLGEPCGRPWPPLHCPSLPEAGPPTPPRLCFSPSLYMILLLIN